MKHLKSLLLIVAASVLLVACGSGGGGGGGDITASVVGTWELTGEIENGVPQNVPAGMVTLVINDTTYALNDNDCNESGTYTVNASNITVTVTAVAPGGVNCMSPGDVDTLPYTVNATTLVIYDGNSIHTFTKR